MKIVAAAPTPKVSCADVCRFAGVLLLLFPCKFLLDLTAFEVLNTSKAADRMFQENGNDALPKALQGVLWMAGNPAPELLMSLEAGKVDPTMRTVTITCGEKFSWSYNRDRGGFLEYFLVTLSWTAFGAGKLEWQFDEEWRFARLFLTVYGKQVEEWYFEQTDADGQTFIRGNVAKTGTKVPKYTALKVIDHAGRRLPAFRQMVEAGRKGTLVEDIPDIIYNDKYADRPKAWMQLEHTNPGVLTLLTAIPLLFGYCMCCLTCFLQTDYRNEKCKYQRMALEAPPALGSRGPLRFAAS